MGSLVVLRAHMADVVSRKSSWGPSESRILLKARGDADIAVDLRRAKLLSSDTKARVIRILLPKPSVERPRVDHDKTVVYDSNDGFIAPKPVSELTQDALKEAQQTFASAANEKEMLDAARKNAELVIGKFLELSDWQAQFVWEDQQ